MPTHLITGVAGQDGALLARALLSRGERVVGTSRSTNLGRVAPLLAGAELVHLDVADAPGFARLLRSHRPDTVVNLAAMSSVAASWKDPERAGAVNGLAVDRMLDAVSSTPTPPRFVQASSSEIFGPPAMDAQLTDEDTPLNPVSPYAEAKAHAHDAVVRARNHGVVASNLVLFGHTSPYQQPHFALPTVARQAWEIAQGRRTALELQDPSIRRDWGSAHDVVRAIVAALDASPSDFVIASGVLTSLSEVAEWALAAAGVQAPVRATGEPSRPHDFSGRVGNIDRARRLLGWQPRIPLRKAIGTMVESYSGRSMPAGGSQ